MSSISQQNKEDLAHQDSDFQLPRLSSITFNIASGYDQKKSPSENITQANRYIIHELSEAVAKINRIHFRKRLEPILQEHGDYIKESHIALIDNYGRATYFYCRLANQIIPIYQPGTIMFESAVKQNSKLNVVAHGSQQNGPLLGNGCATFLAKFHCNLIACYQRICAVSYQDCHHFFPNIYKAALKETLQNFGIQDAKEHGRLISMQETLLGLGGDKMKKDDDDLIRLFHIKDISQIEGRPIDDVGGEKDCPLSYYEYKKIANMRQKDMYFSESAGLFKGKCIAEKTLEEYKSGLMVKSGLVPPDSDEMFKLQMVAMIKQIQETSQHIKNDVIDKAKNYGASRGIFQMEKDKKMVSEYNKQKTEKQQLSGTASQNSGDLNEPVPSTQDEDEEKEKEETQSQLSRSSTRTSTLYSLFSESVDEDDDDELQEQLGKEWLLQAIEKNQRIKNYNNSMLADLKQILKDGEISRVGGFHYSNMKLNQILAELGHFTPMLGSILHIFGFLINSLEESDIKKRLEKICSIIPPSAIKQTAQKIVTEIIVGRREFLQTLEDKNIRKVIRKLDDWRGKTTKLSKMFDEDIMVEVDSRSIQCVMIGLPIQKYQKIYNDQDRMKILIDDITDAFFNPQPVSTITGNLSNDEKPIQFRRGAKQFELHLDLFSEYKKELPSYMKRLKGESAIEHQQRCQEFLLNVGQEHFDRLGMICDPNSPRRKDLFLVYTNALKARKKKQEKKKKGKCAIF